MKNSKRLKGTLEHLAGFGIEPEICLGVNGKALSEETLDRILFRHLLRNFVARPLCPGEIGCALSHYLVMNRIIRENIRRAFIFEDDIRFLEDPRPIIGELEKWSEAQENFILNWGAQKDLRFELPISREVFRSERSHFSIYQFEQMLWYTHCLFVDQAYCIERLKKAFPLVYVFDTYGHLRLRTTAYGLKEPKLTCDPGQDQSTIEGRKQSLIASLFPRHKMGRYRLEKVRSALLYSWVRQQFWSLQESHLFLDVLEKRDQTS